ncbi:hypothetical protein MHK_009664, partial [Candidatus Magnetomorum sp. HK-1]
MKIKLTIGLYYLSLYILLLPNAYSWPIPDTGQTMIFQMLFVYPTLNLLT